MKPSSKPDHTVLQQAANWYARLSVDSVDSATRADWQRWHGQDAMHRQAWLYVERISERFAPLQQDAELAAQTLGRVRRGTSRRHALRSIALLCGGATLGWLGWRHSPLPQAFMAWRADYRSSVGEVRALTLSDGTRVWLNSASALNVAMHHDRRVLQLVEGEVLIETAADPRPLFVHSNHGQMRPLGTRFSVLQQDQQTVLSVFEGAVQVNDSVIAHAGEQLHFDQQTISATTTASTSRQSWREGILAANDMPLSAFIEELSRYRHGHLGVSPQVANLRVMGTFPLHDTEQALAMLQNVLPIQIRRPLPWWLSVEAR
jgi:transmembrane sensor